MELYAEDLKVGQQFTSHSHTVDTMQITRFASDFDPQPFHTGEEAARGTFFGELVASGWHTAAITMRLIVDSLPFTGGIIGVNVEVTWPAPVRPGDTLRVQAEVEAVRRSRSRPERGIVMLHITTRNQHGTVVQSMRTTVLIPYRSGAAS